MLHINEDEKCGKGDTPLHPFNTLKAGWRVTNSIGIKVGCSGYILLADPYYENRFDHWVAPAYSINNKTFCTFTTPKNKEETGYTVLSTEANINIKY